MTPEMKLQDEANAALRQNRFPAFRGMILSDFKKKYGGSFRKFAKRNGGDAARNMLRQILFAGAKHPQLKHNEWREHHQMYGEMIRELEVAKNRASFDAQGLSYGHSFK